jgi:hypothetical protein
MTLVRGARQSIDELVHPIGYRLVEDAWIVHGRLTYVHDDDASNNNIKNLLEMLRPAGWIRDLTKLRAFRHAVTGNEIELEPGGSEVTGHFLHYMRARE